MTSNDYPTIETGLRDYYAQDMVNHFRLTGTITALDRRLSGYTVITLQVGSVADTPVEGSGGERLFTSRFLIRVPKAVQRRWPDMMLAKSACIVTVTGRIDGIIEVIDGREYLLQELIATDIRFIAHFGMVATRPMAHLHPLIDVQRSKADKAAGRKKKESLAELASPETPKSDEGKTG